MGNFDDINQRLDEAQDKISDQFDELSRKLMKIEQKKSGFEGLNNTIVLALCVQFLVLLGIAIWALPRILPFP